jgi:hypothetical protein
MKSAIRAMVLVFLLSACGDNGTAETTTSAVPTTVATTTTTTEATTTTTGPTTTIRATASTTQPPKIQYDWNSVDIAELASWIDDGIPSDALASFTELTKSCDAFVLVLQSTVKTVADGLIPLIGLAEEARDGVRPVSEVEPEFERFADAVTAVRGITAGLSRQSGLGGFSEYASHVEETARDLFLAIGGIMVMAFDAETNSVDDLEVWLPGLEENETVISMIALGTVDAVEIYCR